MHRWPDRIQQWLQIGSWVLVSALLIIFAAVPRFEGWARLAAVAVSVVVGYAATLVVTMVVLTVWSWAMSHRRVRYGGTGYGRGRGGPDPGGGAGVREPRRPHPTGPPPAHQVAETGRD
jgi:hypothetical protein